MKRTKKTLPIIEVSLASADGASQAVGIMNMRQALDLPDLPSLAYSHPDPDKAAAGVTLDRSELAGLDEARRL